MKISTQKIIGLPISIYNSFGLLFLFLLNSQEGFSQHVARTIEKEIPVSENINIKTKGPQSFRVTGVGAINARQIGGRYIVSGKKSTPYVYVIHKSLEINSWNKQSIKQVANIKVESKNKSYTEELLSNLEFDLHENASHSVVVDCEMNIAKFQIHNSWFGQDKNAIILDDGTAYQVDYLEIKTTLYIPSESKLILETDQTDVSLTGHYGEVDLKMKRGSLIADSIHTLSGTCKSVLLKGSLFNSMNLDLKACNLNLLKGKDLSIESSISTINIGDLDQIVIHNSLNDRYTIEDVNQFEVEQSFVTDFKINNVGKSLQMDAKSATLIIDHLSQEF